MPKKIVIIESDPAFSGKLRGAFEQRSLTVVETQDGKGAVDLVKRERPDLVVLSVELSAGQSGYIVCGKLKKDDDLKKIPVIIIGKDAEGFEAHKRLKARAEEYLKKPFEPAAILSKIGELIGLPDDGGGELVLEADESLTLSSLGDDEPLAEPTVAARPQATRGGDPDLDMLDAAFDGISDKQIVGGNDEELIKPAEDEALLEEAPAVEAEPAEFNLGDGDEALESLDAKPADDEIALDALEPLEEAPPPPPKPAPAPRLSTNKSGPVAAVKPTTGPVAPVRSTTGPVAAVKSSTGPVAAVKSSTGKVTTAPRPADDAELRSLRERTEELENKVRELTDEVTAKSNELEAVRSTSGGKDKEFFALKEQVTKKDKEIVRLKQDLNEKEQEVIDLREKENGLEQKASELTTELAKKDAQIKTLTTRVDSAGADRKKVEQQLNAAKDEARNAAAKLSAVQGELDQAQELQAELQAQIQAAQADTESARADAESARGDAEGAKAGLEALKREYEQVKLDLDEARAAADRVGSLEEELSGLRSRASELEESAAKSEERVVKAYQKIKSDEKIREKTRKALAIALQLLDERIAAASPAPPAREGEPVTRRE
jgi:CheY-like chemotaxis protein